MKTERGSVQAASRIAPGDRCWAKTGGGVRSIAWVKDDIGKGYMLSVGSPSSPAQYFGNTKVIPLNAPIRKPLVRNKPPRRLGRRAQSTQVQAITASDSGEGRASTATFLAVSAPSALRPVMKPEKPARSQAYLAWVRRQACCNCFARGPSDPHHEGPHGLGQKTSDFNCVPLCRACHRQLTDSAHHQLPDPSQSALPGKVAMRSLDVSQSIMRATKQQLLLRALGKLPPDRQVEVLAAALAGAEELAHLLT